MPARRRSPVQVRLRRVAETGTISTCYKTDLYSAISQAGRQEINGGVFCKEMKQGVFCKKVDLYPQNETKLTLDLFFILHFTFFWGGAYAPNAPSLPTGRTKFVASQALRSGSVLLRRGTRESPRRGTCLAET